MSRILHNTTAFNFTLHIVYYILEKLWKTDIQQTNQKIKTKIKIKQLSICHNHSINNPCH